MCYSCGKEIEDMIHIYLDEDIDDVIDRVKEELEVQYATDESDADDN